MTAALLLIDLQRDYFVDDELARCRDDLLDRCNDLVGRARQARVPVLEVRTVHSHDRRTWALNMDDDDQGMALEGTRGAERLDGLRAADHVILKTRDSAFHGTELLSWLREREIDRLVLAGVSTESCIAVTATEAYAHDLRVTVVADATASMDTEQHDQTLLRLAQQYRQEVVPAADVVLD